MTAFVLQQTDYIYFVYGLSFFLFGGACFYLSHSNAAFASWQWLGAFGMFHGTKEWLDLAAMCLGDDPERQWLRLIVLTLSYLCLCEFARRTTFGLSTTIDWRWVYLLLLTGSAMGAVWGIDGLNATVRYALGLPAGLLATLVLLRTARVRRGSGRRWLMAAAASLAAYVVSTGLFVPPAPFFPANYFNHVLFLNLFGLPVQLLRTMLAVVSAACVWQFMIARRTESAAMSGSKKHSPYVHLLTVAVAIVTVGGWAMTNAAGQHANQEIQRYFSAYTHGPKAMQELADSWQQQITDHRLVVIGLTGMAIFLLAGSLLTVQGFQDSNAELRRAKEAAEAATQAKSEFLANTSHEIRTPITAVLGYADLLLEPQLSEEDRRNHLHTISRNGEMLLALIDDILDISKVEAGKLDVERIPSSPWQVLADVAALMRGRADRKELALSIESEGLLPETILTDPTRLRQILVNLVGNAVKFTEIGQVRVVVRMSTCAAACSQAVSLVATEKHGLQASGGTPPEPGQEPLLHFDVIDTGIGMTPAQLAMIFRPFTQADSSTNRKYGGTGLGLTISKRLAMLLGGDIAVTSEPNQGSTFRLTIAAGPVAGVSFCDHPRAMVAGTAAAAPRPTLDCRILLAEDSRDNQRLLSLVLEKAGAEVTIARNGHEAVEMALASFPGWGRRHDDPTEPFDIVLMDIQMPEMDGYEATRRLRQEGYDGPIIALSAHATAHAASLCRTAGCDDYLAKPIDRDALLWKIAEYVGNANTEEKRGEAEAGNREMRKVEVT